VHLGIPCKNLPSLPMTIAVFFGRGLALSGTEPRIAMECFFCQFRESRDYLPLLSWVWGTGRWIPSGSELLGKSDQAGSRCSGVTHERSNLLQSLSGSSHTLAIWAEQIRTIVDATMADQFRSGADSVA